jgi:tripartite-type tricarboxylate transporter receptor subunit TctC
MKAYAAALAALTVGFTATAAVTPALSAEAPYPTRAVRLIVPYPPGGPNDVLARMIGAKLAGAWKQKVVIDNRAGAGGNLAVDVAARAPADGYTLILPAQAYAVNPSIYSKVPYTFEQFTPVTIAAKGPLVLVVHPSLGVSSVRELLRLAEDKPGTINYASGGTGSSPHLAGELFKVAAGVDIVHIPYKGTNDAIPDVLSGRVPVFFSSPLIAREHVNAGRLRALGVTSVQRATGWDDVPTIYEAGVKGYEMEAWYAILAQAGTPASIVSAVNQQVARALQAPDVRERLTGLGMEAVGNSPQAAARFIAIEAKKWARVAKAANLRVD